MNTFSYYNTTTGQFAPATYADSRFPAGPPPEQLARWPGYTALLGNFDRTQVRFDLPTQAVVARAACPIAATVAGRIVTLTGVPSGAAYSVSGNASLSGTAEEATLALAFGAPGTYRIAIACFPLLDYSASFTLA